MTNLEILNQVLNGWHLSKEEKIRAEILIAKLQNNLKEGK